MTVDNGNSSTHHPRQLHFPQFPTEDYAEEPKKLSNFSVGLPQFFAVGVKNVLLLSYGMTLGFPTIVIPAIQGGDGREASLEDDFKLTKEQISWFSSINLICVPLGCIFSGALTQPIGRRRAMQVINFPILAAWLLFHYSSDIYMLYAGLCLAGISGGLLEAPVLTYVAEITQPRFRGMLSATGSTCVILGVFIQFLMGSFMKWRTVALFSSCVPVVSSLLLFSVPESPHWLIRKRRFEEAKDALAWLRGWVTVAEVEEEFNDIKDRLMKTIEENEQITFWQKVKLYGRKTFLLPFFIITLCFFIGHFSGMTTLQTYAVQIFHTLKAPIDKYYATILLGVIELAGTIVCVIFVHYTGKRPIVFFSTIGCGLCFLSTATYAYFLDQVPGTMINNIVANSSFSRFTLVIPLNHTTEMPQFEALKAVNGVHYDNLDLDQYFLDPVNDHILNISTPRSVIPENIIVPLPNVEENTFLWLPLTLLLGSAFLSHSGMKLIPWILIGELYPPSVRSGAAGLSGGAGYIFGFLANKLFLKMLTDLTLPGTFWFYSAVTFLGTLILYFILPETEGRSLLEIEQHFTGEKKLNDKKKKVSKVKAAEPQPKGDFSVKKWESNDKFEKHLETTMKKGHHNIGFKKDDIDGDGKREIYVTRL